MKCTIHSGLPQALQLLTKAMPKDGKARPILRNVRMESLDNAVKLTATDLEVGIEVFLPAQVQESGVVVFDPTPFLKIRDTAILVETLHNGVFVGGLTVPTDEDLPEIPANDGGCAVDAAALRTVVKDVAFAMNKDKNRYSLNSLLLCLEGNRMEAVATDQVRLAYSTAYVECTDMRMIIPAKAVGILQTMLKKATVAHVGVEGHNVTFIVGNTTLVARVVDASYPNYRPVFEQFRGVPDVVMNRADMVAALQSIGQLTCDGHRNVRLALEGDRVIFSANTPLGKGSFDLQCAYFGPDLVVGVNPVMLLDFLKSQGKALTEVRMKVLGPGKPVILHTERVKYFLSPASC